MPVESSVLEQIANHSSVPLSFSAAYMNFKGTKIVLVTIYFYTTEKMGLRNNALFFQLQLLRNILGLPLLIYGDFNMDSSVVLESGWVERLNGHLIKLDIDSTLITATSSNIDYFIVTDGVQHLVKNIQPVLTSPWSPHVSLQLTLYASPMSVTGLVHKMPKSLPMEKFKEAWNLMDEQNKINLYKLSKTKATQMLQNQKCKTGTAILGHPTKELQGDPKFQDLLNSSVFQGELLAHVALSAELLVLAVAGIPKNQWKPYLGRSQYPQFERKTVLSKVKHNQLYNNAGLNYWASFKTSIIMMVNQVSSCRLSFLSPTLIDFISNAQHEASQFMLPFFPSEQLDQWNSYFATFDPLYIDNSQLDLLKQLAITFFKSIVDDIAKKERVKWKKFVDDQLRVGGGKLFQIISKEEKAFLNVRIGDRGGTERSPDVMLKNQADNWGQLWNPGDVGLEEEVANALNKLRRTSLNQQSDPINICPQILKSKINSYKKNSKGTDCWTADELKAMPQLVIDDLANVFSSCFNSAANPHQNLLCLNACLGKPSGGVRTISKTPMLYRMVSRCIFDKVVAWEEANVQSYDAAARGSSSLQASLYRNLLSEVAYYNEEEILAIFNDYDKFFDRIDIAILVNKIISTNYPLKDAVLALQQHLSPRVIQCEGFSSLPLLIFKSIIAGCMHSVAFTRTLLLEDMMQLVKDNEEVDTSCFVDDTSMIDSFPGVGVVYNRVAKCIVQFAKIVKKLKLKLSEKAVIVSSSMKLALKFKEEFQDVHKVVFQVSKASRDLGLCFNAARNRPAGLLNERLEKVHPRSTKVKNIAKTNKLSKTLYKGSVYPASTYGHSAAGIPPSVMNHLEKEALACCGATKPGRCRTTSLIVNFGLLHNPYAKIVSETVSNWFGVLNKAFRRGKVPAVSKAWFKAYQDINEQRYPARQCKGIMSNMIVCLSEAGWSPKFFNNWFARNGDEYKLNFSVSPKLISKLVIEDHFSQELVKAAEGYQAKGMQNGIDWTMSLALHRALLKPKAKQTVGEDIDTEYLDQLNRGKVVALETIHTGAYWPAERVNAAYPDEPSICKFCGAPVESPLHAYWTCPCHQQSSDTIILDTNYLIDEAVADDEHQVLWNRGLLPLDLVVIPQEFKPPFKHTIHFDQCMPGEVWGSGNYYGDGSGGENSRYHALRRCGSGLIKADSEGNVLLSCWSVLPGDVQTVPRSEIHACLLLLELLEDGSQAMYHTDHKNLVTNYYKGKDFCKNNINSDLYAKIFDFIHDKQLTINMTWVKAHLYEDDILPEHMTPVDVRANKKADKMASKGAAYADLAPSISAPIKRLYYKLRLIQQRLIHIIINLPSRESKVRVKKVRFTLPSIEEEMIGSQHKCILAAKGTRIQCTDCLSSVSINATLQVRSFLRGICPGARTTKTDLTTIKQPDIHVGKQSIHPSHVVKMLKGCFWCNTCGACSQSLTKLQLLAKKCEGKPAPRTNGSYNLSSLQKGNLPSRFRSHD